MAESGKFRFAIDRGGTFTDVIALCPGGKVRVMKLLSEDPSYSDAPREAIRRILEEETGRPHPADKPVDTSLVEWIRMGTTVATNALLERKGEPVALVITQGFRDLLEIGNQQRPRIFDLAIQRPELLYKEIVEVEERVVLQRADDSLSRPANARIELIKGTSGDIFEVWRPVNVPKLRVDLQAVYDRGIRSVAVVLMHSYTFENHEIQIGRIAEDIGFTNISLSCQVMPMVRIVPRGQTTCVDAYLTPHIKRYLTSFASGFRDNLKGVHVMFMRSDGGLTSMENFIGSQAIVSGPAGGVVGFAATGYEESGRAPLIGYDMGGTSTDVSRYAGEFDHTFEATVSGVNIQVPQLDINTVAAGGGSQLFFRSGIFAVGPDSAGANPGPACYKRGGPLTITDANAVLGRLLPDYFPQIFGPKRNEPLDIATARNAFEKLAGEINQFAAANNRGKMSVEEIAEGFVAVANEAMSRPIRNLTQARGFDPSNHVLSCFGGAGGSTLATLRDGPRAGGGRRIQTVWSRIRRGQFQRHLPENRRTIGGLHRATDPRWLPAEQISITPFLNMRYDRTDCALMVHPEEVRPHDGMKHGDFLSAFTKQYQREFGFTLPNRKVVIDDIRVRASAEAVPLQGVPIETALSEPKVEKVVKVYFAEAKSHVDTGIFNLATLRAGHSIPGPAIILDKNTTILVKPNCVATVSRLGSIIIDVENKNNKGVDTALDPIQLSIFGHRFMSIAEQMGRVLQRTAISTNIKERLDFSCALFGPDGGLVSNAPHIPVHLGAMQEAVQYQMRQLAGNIFPGDVILSNHPVAGGSHLPDLTVITPVFFAGAKEPVFFVANRGHHADIGGLTPGSMPPNSTSLDQEGAVFKCFKLVKEGVFQEEDLVAALMAPSKLPGCSGTRNLNDNLSDLHAQIAANQKGIELVSGLIKEYSLEVVQVYMGYIQSQAEEAVRDLLRSVAKRALADTGSTILFAEDKLDDGSTIALTITIDAEAGQSEWNFTGTSPQVWGNWNAPRAITLSAIIYSLRCMVEHEIPLNQGCLKPVKIVVPQYSLLDPDEMSAVVGGNVLTSQRIVDVILKAFSKCAASQGCMNNITFGNDSFGYYETVAGGAGGGPTWDGVSGVHTHMTNTRITDPEILEKRYPVLLQTFSLNKGSGGTGQHPGGDGVVREIFFRAPVTLSVLTERRVFQPYGMNGGGPGASGHNLLLRQNGQIVNLGSKNAVPIVPGDCFRLLTPGGGGYGAAPE
ncbi:5-oxoprolinase [Hypsibius exemplaris]|uniref:5-oxoprolinase n=1 Tax=Hypsibius exemplaris TaxID=2072580 RepID=A0A1W0X203_HYPEX|nr:5-oxoprolinase [Hypsibius exemplaris]